MEMYLYGILVMLEVFAGLYLWVRVATKRQQLPNPILSAWPDRSTDSFIFFWVLFMFFLLAPYAISELLTQAGIELTGSDQLAMLALSGQLPLLGIFILYAKPIKPVGELMAQIKPTMADGKNAGISFLLCMPILAVVGILWNSLLDIAKDHGAPITVEHQEVVTQVTEGGGIISMILLSISIAIFAPLVEELLFRGIIYRVLKSYIPHVAVLLSALLFSAIHMNLYSAGPLFVLGIFLALSYERTGRIAVPILFHMIFNVQNLIVLKFISPEMLEL